MKREQVWEMRYIVTKDGEQVERVCHPRSEEQRDSNMRKAKELGYKVVSCKKLYPFSTQKNQHNFALVGNICSNRMYDIAMGEQEQYEREYEKLEGMKEKADKFFCYPLPVAWVTWEDLCEMKELSSMAILHRQESCIRAGRPELVTYC